MSPIAYGRIKFIQYRSLVTNDLFVSNDNIPDQSQILQRLNALENENENLKRIMFEREHELRRFWRLTNINWYSSTGCLKELPQNIVNDNVIPDNTTYIQKEFEHAGVRFQIRRVEKIGGPAEGKLLARRMNLNAKKPVWKTLKYSYYEAPLFEAINRCAGATITEQSTRHPARPTVIHKKNATDTETNNGSTFESSVAVDVDKNVTRNLTGQTLEFDNGEDETDLISVILLITEL